MRRFWQRIVFVMLVSLLTVGFASASTTTPPQRGGAGREAVDMTKLNYLFSTNEPRLVEARQSLFKELQLQPNEQTAFLAAVDTQRQNLSNLYQESIPIVRSDTKSLGAKREAIASMSYNERVALAANRVNGELRTLLADRYGKFQAWMRSWWEREREIWLHKQDSQSPGIQADASVCYVYATQYNGYSSYEVALPDKYVKFANLGRDYRYPNPPYTVDIWRSGGSVNGVTVRDVGPWNEDDNYWNNASGENSRRLFRDLGTCYPEAEEAYFNGYNGGRDQFGRRVTNPAGIDLTPNVAANLGLGYLQNAWVYVRYDDLPPVQPPPVTLSGRIEMPGSNATVSGTITISGWAKADGGSMSRVEIWIDGVKRGDATYGLPRSDLGGNFGWNWSWDTSPFTEGTHQIEVRAIAASGVWTPFLLAVTVSKPVPVGWIDSPRPNRTIFGVSPVVGWARVENSSISRVEFWVDGVKSTDGAYALLPPDSAGNVGWQWYWDTKSIVNGSHSIVVKAIAANGKESILLNSGDQRPSTTIDVQNRYFFADVTGDGLADVIDVRTTGVYVTASGARYAQPTLWTERPFYGQRGTFFADVDGDRKADLIVVNNNFITVRISTGTSFAYERGWTADPYYGSIGTSFADVNGDGRADAIAVSDTLLNNRVNVRLSTGSSFAVGQDWTLNPYYGSRGTFFADVNNDRRADAIVVNDITLTNRVVVRSSTGSSFADNQDWTHDQYVGALGSFFADVNGDGRADAIVVNDASLNNRISVRLSTGSVFAPKQDWTTDTFYGDQGVSFADANGDGRADAITVLNTTSSGGPRFVVRLSTGSGFSSPVDWWQPPPTLVQ